MKVWWVVAWDDYYPSEELKNVRGTFNSKQEAIDFADKIRQFGNDIQYEYQGKMIEYNETYEHIEVINVCDMLGLIAIDTAIHSEN